jgi:hypothetical protein
VFLIPAHPLALGLFLLYMIAQVVGHLGFEVFGRSFARHPLTRWHTTPTHHDLHHRRGHGNYGLYFSLGRASRHHLSRLRRSLRGGDIDLSSPRIRR